MGSLEGSDEERTRAGDRFSDAEGDEAGTGAFGPGPARQRTAEEESARLATVEAGYQSMRFRNLQAIAKEQGVRATGLGVTKAFLVGELMALEAGTEEGEAVRARTEEPPDATRRARTGEPPDATSAVMLLMQQMEQSRREEREEREDRDRRDKAEREDRDRAMIALVGRMLEPKAASAAAPAATAPATIVSTAAPEAPTIPGGYLTPATVKGFQQSYVAYKRKCDIAAIQPQTMHRALSAGSPEQGDAVYQAVVKLARTVRQVPGVVAPAWATALLEVERKRSAEGSLDPVDLDHEVPEAMGKLLEHLMRQQQRIESDSPEGLPVFKAIAEEAAGYLAGTGRFEDRADRCELKIARDVGKEFAGGLAAYVADLSLDKTKARKVCDMWFTAFREKGGPAGRFVANGATSAYASMFATAARERTLAAKIDFTDLDEYGRAKGTAERNKSSWPFEFPDPAFLVSYLGKVTNDHIKQFEDASTVATAATPIGQADKRAHVKAVAAVGPVGAPAAQPAFAAAGGLVAGLDGRAIASMKFPCIACGEKGHAPWSKGRGARGAPAQDPPLKVWNCPGRTVESLDAANADRAEAQWRAYIGGGRPGRVAAVEDGEAAYHDGDVGAAHVAAAGAIRAVRPSGIIRRVRQSDSKVTVTFLATLESARARGQKAALHITRARHQCHTFLEDSGACSNVMSPLVARNVCDALGVSTSTPPAHYEQALLFGDTVYNVDACIVLTVEVRIGLGVVVVENVVFLVPTSWPSDEVLFGESFFETMGIMPHPLSQLVGSRGGQHIFLDPHQAPRSKATVSAVRPSASREDMWQLSGMVDGAGLPAVRRVAAVARAAPALAATPTPGKTTGAHVGLNASTIKAAAEARAAGSDVELPAPFPGSAFLGQPAPAPDALDNSQHNPIEPLTTAPEPGSATRPSVPSTAPEVIPRRWEDDEKLRDAVGKMVDRALASFQGAGPLLREEFKSDREYAEFIDMFVAGVWARVGAFRVRLLEDDLPCTAPAWDEKLIDPTRRTEYRRQPRRQYAESGKAYAEAHMARLAKVTCVSKMHALNDKVDCHCISPCILVIKPDGSYRVAFDMRELNDILQYIGIVGPTRDELIAMFTGCHWFMTLDLLMSFWQLLLTAAASELHILSTPDNTWRSHRVIMGSKNSTAALLCAVRYVLGDLLPQRIALAYADDGGAGAPSARELVILRVWPILDALSAGRLYCNPTKCMLAATSLVWIGRLLRGGHVSLDPEQVDALAAAIAPRNLAELVTFVGLISWLADHLPAIAEVMAPLQDLKTTLLKPMRSKKTAACERVSLAGHWLVEPHERAFRAALEMVRNSCELYLPDPAEELCIFTDASHSHWSACLFACKAENMTREHAERGYKPVAMCSGTFTPTGVKWGTPEKEVFAAVQAMRRFRHHVLRPAGAHLYVDHQNMAACYNLVFGPNHVAAGRVSRWAASLTSLPLTVHYLAGPKNIWADYLSRARNPAFPSSEDGGRARAGPPHSVAEGDVVAPQATPASIAEGDVAAPPATTASVAEGDVRAVRAAGPAGDAVPANPTASCAARSLEGEGALHAREQDAAIERNLGLVAAARRARRPQQVPSEPAATTTAPHRETFTYSSGRTSAVMHPAFAYASRDEISRRQKDALAGRGPTDARLWESEVLPDLLKQNRSDTFVLDEQGNLASINGHPTSTDADGVICVHTRARAPPDGGPWRPRLVPRKDKDKDKDKDIDETEIPTDAPVVSDAPAVPPRTVKRIWIPVGQLHLHARICTVAHAGAACHRGVRATLVELQFFYWLHQEDWVDLFIRRCLNCRHLRLPGVVPRPLGRTFAPNRPGQCVSFDFFTICPKNGQVSASSKAVVVDQSSITPYLLVIKDLFTRAVFLVACPAEDAVHAAWGLSRYCGIFGVPDALTSDNASAFVGSVMDDLETRMGCDRLVSDAYASWSRGSVESAGKALRDMFRSLCSERQFPITRWEVFIDLVMWSYNTAKLGVLGDVSPFELIHGRAPRRPLDFMLEFARRDPTDPKSENSAILHDDFDFKDESLQTGAYFTELTTRLRQLHDTAYEHSLKVNEKARAKLNASYARKPLRLVLGDYVMMHTQRDTSARKYMPNWTGPHQVVEILSDHRYVVQNVVTEALNPVHASFLAYYDDSALEVTPALREQAAFDTYGFVVERLGDFRFDEAQDKWEALRIWKGCKDSDQSSVFVPVNELLDLVPKLTRLWLRNLLKDKTTSSAATSICEKAGLDVNFIKTGHVLDL